MPGILCHNCEGKGHIACVCPSPRINNSNKVSVPPISNSAQTPSPQHWLMDSRTTHHVTPDLDNLGIHYEYQGPEEVTIGNDSKLPISHIGKSSVVVCDNKFNLDDILHVPTATQNLLSISSFAKSNQVSIEFFPGHFLTKDLVTKDIVHTGPSNDGLYSLPTLNSSITASYTASLGFGMLVWIIHPFQLFVKHCHLALLSHHLNLLVYVLHVLLVRFIKFLVMILGFKTPSL
ncbi:hypothetical protein T459_19011 [Capsicum annuum]|uniref:Retrovirus-related Pol polyprotein from transposon TNT 1-94-like beta-barrel domain-containing protein n=1 Tax=Capsicum annuum TaxID=4072 RepID=A0A2G2Z0I4_CAPAN|nr:hypothetical protein T459_19011 [Capsicum annuum]